MFRKAMTALAAAAGLIASASLASGFGAGGGMGGGGIGGGGIHGGGFGGVGAGAIGSVGRVSGLNPGVLAINPASAPQRYRELKVAGQVPADPTRLVNDARIVQLRVNGHIIPMALDTELVGGELQFLPNEAYGRDLYKAMMTRRIEVVGESNLRQEIVEAASDPGNPKPLQVQGYVFDRLSPFLVLRSVSALR